MEKDLALKNGSPLAALQMALSGDMSVEKLEKMLELQERWESNEAKKAYVQAMAAFKAKPPKIKKDRHVRFATQKGVTEYNHASLGNVTEAINSALAENGLSAGWKTEQDQTGIKVTCTITHNLGYSENTSLTAPAESSGTKNSIQAIGSTITYLQRYTLLALTGLATHEQDDDGINSEQAVITESQAESIRKALTETKSDESLFLAHIGAESVETIPVTKFLLAITSINKKAEQSVLKTTEAWKKWFEVKAIDPDIVREWKDPVSEKQCLEYVKKAQALIDKQNSDGEAA
jgi:hypothetical protein